MTKAAWRLFGVAVAILGTIAKAQGDEHCDVPVLLTTSEQETLKQKLLNKKHCFTEPPETKKGKDAGDTYDIVIDVEDLEKVMDRDESNNKGWPLEVASQEAWSTILDRATLKVAVIGMYNRGKTFLINALSKRNLKASSYHNTRGISVVIDRETDICYMDTAGENRALKLNGLNSTEANTLIAQHENGVQFLQDAAIQIADVVMIVVNQMTLEDQRYIQAIAQKLYMRKKDDKVNRAARMIVVHNLKNDHTEPELQVLIKQDIEEASNAVRHREWPPLWKSEAGGNGIISHMYVPKMKQGKEAETSQGIEWLRQDLKAEKAEIFAAQMQASFLDKFVKACKDNLGFFFDGLEPKTFETDFKLMLKGANQAKHNFQIGPNAQFKLSTRTKVENWKVVTALDSDIAWTSYADSTIAGIFVEIPGVLPHAALKPDRNDTRVQLQDFYEWYGEADDDDEDGKKALLLRVRIQRETHQPYVYIETWRVMKDREYLADDSGKHIDGYTFVKIYLKSATWYDAPTKVEVSHSGVLELSLPIVPKM